MDASAAIMLRSCQVRPYFWLMWALWVGVPMDAVADRAGTLPSLHRVTQLDTASRQVTGDTTVGYGYSGAVLDADDAHHRLSQRLGIALLFDGLGAAVEMHGRLYSHSSDMEESRRQWIGDVLGRVQLAHGISNQVAVGLELRAWLPGGDQIPRLSLSATSPEAVAAVRLNRAGGLVVGQLGYRIDNFQESVSRPGILTGGERLSLEMGAGNRVLVGVGAGIQRGSALPFVEVTSAILTDSDAKFSQMPHRAAAGVRMSLSNSWSVSTAAEVALSRRPEPQLAGYSVPVDPRLALVVGLSYSNTMAGRRSTSGVVSPTVDETVVHVLDEQGQPVPGAMVQVVEPAGAEVSARGPGRFSLRLPRGDVVLSIEAPGYRRRLLRAQAGAGTGAPVEAKMTRLLPEGELRGLIQSFQGKPVKAVLTIEPGGHKIESGSDGGFQIELKPGSYQVRIHAEGFAEQVKTIVVPKDGVEILNVDLRAL